MILPAWITRSWCRPTRAGFTGLARSSGGRSKRFSRGPTATRALPKRCPTAKRARRCSSAPARAVPGAICRRPTVRGTPFTCGGAALVDAGVPERAAQAILAGRQTAGDFDPALALLDSTVASAHQHAAGARKKKRRRATGPGPLARGPFHEDPPGGRRRVYGVSDEPERGPSQRRAPRRATRR